MKVRTLLIATTASLAIVGCANDGHSNEGQGALLGAVIGGLAGSHVGGGNGRVFAIAGGAIAGAIIGGNIGAHMDAQDRARMNGALETVPTGQSTTWNNPDTNTQYTVRPTRTYREHERYCREYTTTAIIAGKEQQVYGKACRQPDGTWEAVK